MSLPKTVTMTRAGGRFYRAQAVNVLVTYGVLLLPMLIVTLIAVINPFWFRESFFNWVERTINRITVWRNRLAYRVYLGTDPKLWHSLKGDINE
jgi:hypothetical protein